MKLIIRALVVGLMASSAVADDFPGFTMGFEEIGIAGNTADTTGHGAVSYSYRIGTHEVTENQFVRSGVGNGNEGSLGADAPATLVSWHEAARFCNWLTTGTTNSGAYTLGSGGLVTGMMSRSAILADGGMFYVLPTLDEWYKAAYFDASGGGAGYSTYADGTSDIPIAGTEVNYNDAVGSAWVVGFGYNEQNGTKDMMGNVWEWLESPPDGNPDNRLVSGGSWATDSQSLKNTGSRPGFAPGTEGVRLGLRIVAIPEPGTISLMGLSTISLFFTRTVRRRKLAGQSLLPVRREHFCDAYCSLDEWEASFREEEETVGFLDDLWEAVLPSLQSAWSKVHAHYKALDRVFWNRMVVLHESRTVARKAFRKALKKNALACFDGFLALFMK